MKAIDDALGLIERHDPLRFARLKREVKTIVNGPVRTGGSYSHRFKICRIDLNCFDMDEDREAWTILVACVLVHETTHGVLMSRKVLQNKDNFARIETLCFKEEVRFARKLGIDVSHWESYAKDAKPAEFAEEAKFAIKVIKRLFTTS